MKYQNSIAFARKQDRHDALRAFRKLFYIPAAGSKPAIYFTGNSLGLQPRSTRKFILEELTDWARLGVEGHFHAGRPWVYFHKFSKKALATLVGAKPSEVVAMNQLTVNLHLMMVSFYSPSATRYKILTEAGSFSSDQYAFESQVRGKGIDPADAIVELTPRPGEFCLRTEDIVQAIRDQAGQLALVIFGAVQYYSGQYFNLREITSAGHKAGAIVGFDLAHAIGNVPLHLHHDGVDFAVWCSYKYLNSGPGGVGGVFVHKRHATNVQLPRLAGWWGHDEKERFQMKKGFSPMAGADGWQISNFPVISGAAHLASLKIFQEVGMEALRKKSIHLTGYLEFLLREIKSEQFTLITPEDPASRGCQLSILMKVNGRKVFHALTKKGIVADWREPDVIRVAPVPLYNTFEEVWRFAEVFKEALNI
jgi:kynureninase